MAFLRNQISNKLSSVDEIHIQVSNDNLEDETLETIPLLFANQSKSLPASKSSGWLGKAAKSLSNGANSIKSSVSNYLKHPLPTILGMGTAAQPSISAFVNPSKIDPKEISATWWSGLSGTMRLQSMLGLIFSFSVNFPVNKKFIEDAWVKLKDNSKNTFNSAVDFVDNITSIFLGLNSGMAAAAITFEAFLWVTFGGVLIPALFAALSFLNASTSRYIGIKRVFGLLRNVFNPDAGVQRKSIDALKHLNMD